MQTIVVKKSNVGAPDGYGIVMTIGQMKPIMCGINLINHKRQAANSLPFVVIVSAFVVEHHGGTGNYSVANISS